MTKKVLFALLALMAFASAEVLAQAQLQRQWLPITVIYPNKGRVADTASSTPDTIDIGVIGRGSLAPVAVTVNIRIADADVSAIPDSVSVEWQAGIGGFYEHVGAAVPVRDTLHVRGDTTRTLVFNTTGAATARNAQAYVWPYCDAIRLILDNASGAPAADTFRYEIKVAGLYESGRFYAKLPVRYKNKGATADSIGLAATPDTVRIGVLQFGDAAPLGVGVAFKAIDADVSAAADSLLVASFGSIDGRKYEELATPSEFGDIAPIGAAGTGYGIRTYVFNTTGAAAARNGFQATTAPHFNSLMLLLSPDDNTDTVRYEIKAMGIYQKN
jgi:hypothetical protein